MAGLASRLRILSVLLSSCPFLLCPLLLPVLSSLCARQSENGRWEEKENEGERDAPRRNFLVQSYSAVLALNVIHSYGYVCVLYTWYFTVCTWNGALACESPGPLPRDLVFFACIFFFQLFASLSCFSRPHTNESRSFVEKSIHIENFRSYSFPPAHFFSTIRHIFSLLLRNSIFRWFCRKRRIYVFCVSSVARVKTHFADYSLFPFNFDTNSVYDTRMNDFQPHSNGDNDGIIKKKLYNHWKASVERFPYLKLSSFHVCLYFLFFMRFSSRYSLMLGSNGQEKG